jgi:hypothetical protein
MVLKAAKNARLRRSARLASKTAVAYTPISTHKPIRKITAAQHKTCTKKAGATNTQNIKEKADGLEVRRRAEAELEEMERASEEEYRERVRKTPALGWDDPDDNGWEWPYYL